LEFAKNIGYSIPMALPPLEENGLTPPVPSSRGAGDVLSPSLLG